MYYNTKYYTKYVLDTDRGRARPRRAAAPAGSPSGRSMFIISSIIIIITIIIIIMLSMFIIIIVIVFIIVLIIIIIITSDARAQQPLQARLQAAAPLPRHLCTHAISAYVYIYI